MSDEMPLAALCKQCMIKDCVLRADTPPKDCVWLAQTLETALRYLPDETYNVFLQCDELTGRFYLCRHHRVVGVFGHPSDLLGQLLLRAAEPGWFLER